MTRRALFAALASLPFVGRFVKKPANGWNGFRHKLYLADDDAAYRVIAADKPTNWIRLTDLDGRTTRYLYTRADGAHVAIHLPGAA